MTDDATPQQEKDYVRLMVVRSEEVQQAAATELTRRQHIRRLADKRRDHDAAHPETLFHYQPGELVWRRTKGWSAGGKLAPKAVGPYRVLRVKGVLGQRVTIEAVPAPG